jgi:hypothetical protein
MAVDTFSCPECQVKLRRSPHLQTGAKVQCPRCRMQFPVPPPDVLPADAAPPPLPIPRGTAVDDHPDTRDEGRPDDRPRRDEDRDRDELVGTGRRREGERDRDQEWDRDRDDQLGTGPRRRPRYDREYDRGEPDEDYPRVARAIGTPDDLSADYQVDLGLWFAYAKEHYGAILGPFIGFLLVYLAIYLGIVIINAVIAGVGTILSIVVLPPLSAGFTVVALAQLKGKRWTFNDFFTGFNWFGQTVVVNLLTSLASTAAALPGLILVGVAVGVIVGTAGPGGPAPEMFLLLAPGILVALAGILYVAVRMNFYAVPLIIDRNFGIMDALSGSWKLCRGHMAGLIGVSIILVLINFGGFLACLIGGLFTAPFTVLVHTVAYLLVAGTQPPVSSQGLSGGESGPIRRDEYDY